MSSKTQIQKHQSQIRTLVIVFIIAIWFSGLTAIPLESELGWMRMHSGWLPGFLQDWISQVYSGVYQTNKTFPFISYGTDWLAFAHFIIGLLFIGLLRDPVRNKWIVDWSLICCILVFPVALIFGPIRHIPFFHQVIDCSFGFVGLLLLGILRREIQSLEKLTAK